jgi:hypothetical protein
MARTTARQSLSFKTSKGSYFDPELSIFVKICEFYLVTQSLYELYGDAITPTPYLSLPEEYTAEGVLGVLGSTLWLLLVSTRFTGPPYESYTGAWGPPYESSAGPDFKFLCFAIWCMKKKN